MFEDRQKTAYAKLKNGKVEVYQGKGVDPLLRDRIVARVTGVKEKEFEYQGEQMKSWVVNFVDESGDVAELSLGYSSGFTRGFFNSLAAADFSKPISISCYVKIYEGKEYNTPSLWQNNEMLKWVKEDMPKTKRVKVGSKSVIDDADAIEWTKGLVNEINNKIDALNIGLSKTTEQAAEIMGGKVEDIPSNLPF
jgi:hypothetical protein